jgi:hypothetical protein
MHPLRQGAAYFKINMLNTYFSRKKPRIVSVQSLHGPRRSSSSECKARDVTEPVFVSIQDVALSERKAEKRSGDISNECSKVGCLTAWVGGSNKKVAFCSWDLPSPVIII